MFTRALYLQKVASLLLDDRDAAVGVVRRAGSLRFDYRDLRRVLRAVLHVLAAQTLPVVLSEDEQH